jgi:hypothetical protein
VVVCTGSVLAAEMVST